MTKELRNNNLKKNVNVDGGEKVVRIIANCLSKKLYIIKFEF